MKSPFKFLDAYERQDKAIFFGREAPVADLYRLVFESNLVLVYGTSGTGKTSLIQCGLANRFQPSDWFELFVRRKDDINAALDEAIRARATTEIAPEASVVEAVHSLYLDHLRPIYLIFDQFEELFIMGSTEEQDRFIASIAALLDSNVSCKIIISLREEYLARLHHFEKALPTLFNKRLRVEAMSMTDVEAVIIGTTEAFGIVLEHGIDTARLIIDQLDDDRVGVQLAYLQVYLDSLYRHNIADGQSDPVTFDDEAIRAAGKLGDIMADFVETQSAAIQSQLAKTLPTLPPTAIHHLLEEFVTIDGTKQPTTLAELSERLPTAVAWLEPALDALESARLLRQTDDRYELAHDALARRIAEGRSTERKSLLQVQKMVRDRIDAWPQTRTLLNAEELALVSRSATIFDPISRQPMLTLTPIETKFLKRSESSQRWRRGRWIVGAVGLTSLVFLALFVTSFFSAHDPIVRSIAGTDSLAYRAYSYVRDGSAPTQAQAGDPDAAFYASYARENRHDLLRDAARLNAEREAEGSIAIVSTTPDFWNSLLEIDLLVDGATEGDVTSPVNIRRLRSAYADYNALAQPARDTLAEDATNWYARVQLKAVLFRLFSSRYNFPVEGAGPDAGERKELLRVMIAEDQPALVDYYRDIIEVCFLTELAGPLEPLCTPYRSYYNAAGAEETPDAETTGAPAQVN